MGLVNTIIGDGKCPCGEIIKSWQSKDLYNRMNIWKLGEKIVIEDCNQNATFRLEGKGDDIWTGVGLCKKYIKNKGIVGCGSYLECDIIIKDGVIKEIKNIREKVIGN
jgi:hypothetical protein